MKKGFHLSLANWFSGFTYRLIGEGLLTGGEGSLTGTQVTQRQLHPWPHPTPQHRDSQGCILRSHEWLPHFLRVSPLPSRSYAHITVGGGAGESKELYLFSDSQRNFGGSTYTMGGCRGGGGRGGWEQAWCTWRIADGVHSHTTLDTPDLI